MQHERPTVLIIGATGAVGGALCRLYAAEGWTVHALGRNAEKLRAIAAETGAQPHRADLADLEDSQRVAERLRGAHIDHAVAAVGGWYVQERGLQLPLAKWDATIASNLSAHFVAARAFAPILTGTSPVYLALNGIASHQPCEGSLAICVAGAGQSMMLDVLATEGKDDSPAYAELVVDTPILLPGQVHDKDEPTHSIEQVGAALRWLAQGPHTAGRVTRHHLG